MGRSADRDDALAASVASAWSTGKGALVGVFTNGDLVAPYERHVCSSARIGEVMTRAPKSWRRGSWLPKPSR